MACGWIFLFNKMKIFTKRELVVIEVVILLVFLFIVAPSFMANIHEFIYLIFVVLPLGILIMTDKERLARQQENETSDIHRPPTDPP